MSSLIYILTMGVVNALRGGAPEPRPPYLILKRFLSRPLYMASMALNTMAMLFGLGYCGMDLTFAVFTIALFLSLWAGFAPGWGKYFNAAFPNMKYVTETEVKIIDDITTRIYKNPVNEKEFSRWCLIAMSIRGLLFYPVFIVLSFANLYTLIFGLGMVLLGPIYWARKFLPEVISVRVAEFTTGCLLGGLICLSLTI